MGTGHCASHLVTAASPAQPQPALLLHCASAAFNLNTQNAPNWEGLQRHLSRSLGPPCGLSLVVSIVFIPIGRSFSSALFWGSALLFPFPCVLIPVYNSLVSGLILTLFQSWFEPGQSWVLKQAISSGVQPARQPSLLLSLHFCHRFSCAWV